jgi:hypothetical protein
MSNVPDTSMTEEEQTVIKRKAEEDFADVKEWNEKFMRMTTSELGDELGRMAGVLFLRRVITPRAFSLLINAQCRMQPPSRRKRGRKPA